MLQQLLIVAVIAAGVAGCKPAASGGHEAAGAQARDVRYFINHPAETERMEKIDCTNGYAETHPEIDMATCMAVEAAAAHLRFKKQCAAGDKYSCTLAARY
jgi:hypothetical protein